MSFLSYLAWTIALFLLGLGFRRLIRKQLIKEKYPEREITLYGLYAGMGVSIAALLLLDYWGIFVLVAHALWFGISDTGAVVKKKKEVEQDAGFIE